MRTEKEMRNDLMEYCRRKICSNCKLKLYHFSDSCYVNCDFEKLKRNHEIVFGKDEEEMNVFKKEDIKPGYLLVIRDEDSDDMAIVTYGRCGNLCYSGPYVWGDISDFGDDLYHIHDRNVKIMKIYGYTCNRYAYRVDGIYDRNLLWERKEPKEMTVKEIEEVLGYPVKIIKEK